MKKKAIIVTENNSEAYEMQGILPKIFYFLYFWLYRLEVSFLILFLKRSYAVSLICTRDLFEKEPKGIDKVYYYDELFRSVNFESKRDAILSFCRNWPNYKYFSEIKSQLYFRDMFLPKIVQTRFAIILAYSGIPIYWHGFEEIFSNLRPEKIIFLSKASKPEIIGEYLAKKKKIPAFSIFINLTNIDLSIKRYARYIDRKLRIKEILSMSKDMIKKDVKPKILLVASMPMYLKSAIPLMKKLTNDNVLLLSAIYETENKMKEIDKNIPWEYLFAYLKEDETRKIFSDFFQKFRKIYNNIAKVNKDPDDESELLFNLSKEELKLLFYSYFPQACVYISAFESFLRNNKIRTAVVFSDRGIFENVVCQFCKRLGIKTIHVSPNNVMSPDKSNEYNIADIVTVPGLFMRDELVKIGRDSEDIKVVGDLKLDTVSLYKSEEFKLKVQKKYKIEEGKKNILLISWPIIPSVPYAEKEAFFKGVYESVGKIQNSQLIVKPHPNESLGTLIEHLELWGMGNTPVIQSLNLLEFLAITDVMVMIWSMAAFEAIAMNVPVIAVNFAQKDYGRHIPYAAEKGVVEVTNADELYLELKSLLEDRKYYAERIQNGLGFGQKYFGSLDGKAAERIAEIINKIH